MSPILRKYIFDKLQDNKLHHRRPQTGRPTTKHSQVHLMNINKKGDKRRQKGDKTDTVTHKKGDKGRQAGRKADTLSRSKADTLRKP